MKTLIAIPCMDQVPAQFANCLAMLQKVGDCAVSFNVGSLVYDSRDTLAKRAIQMEADYVFWLDSDMVFPTDTLVHMMDTVKEKDLDFLTGMYFRRVQPFTPTLFRKLVRQQPGKGFRWTGFEEIPNEIFEVEGCGFGCVLMSTSVLMDVAGKFGDMFGPIERTGEDLSFCWRARECGYKLYCDPSIPLGHVGHTVITRGYWEEYKKELEARRSTGEWESIQPLIR